MKQNIAVFFGGKSPEHDISIITGHQVLKNLNEFNYNIIPVYIDKNNCFYTGSKLSEIENYKEFNEKGLSKVFFLPGSCILYKHGRFSLKKLCRIDAAVNACHGGSGEDGSLHTLLAMCGIACTSASLLPASVAMCKIATKHFLNGVGINCLPFVTVQKSEMQHPDEVFARVTDKLQYPVIVKPATLGSSIGISFCQSSDTLAAALELAFTFCDKVLIEKGLSDYQEYNVSLFRHAGEIKISEIENPIKTDTLLSFTDKYISGNKAAGTMQNVSRIFPAEILPELSLEIKENAFKAYDMLGISGVVRIDFLYSDNKLYLNEINTIPGSLAFYLWKGIYTFSSLLDCLIKQAKQEQAAKNALLTSFKSSVLQSYQQPHGSKSTKTDINIQSGGKV